MLPQRTLDSKTYKDVIQAIETTQTSLIHPQPGDTFTLGEDQFTILGPLSEEYSEVNNSSIVLRYVHGQTSILFTEMCIRDSLRDDQYLMVFRRFRLSLSILIDVYKRQTYSLPGYPATGPDSGA